MARSTAGTISGEVFNDLNGNGTLDSGEPGLANWTVELFKSGSGLVATTTTGTNGLFSFNSVGVGAYTVEEVLQNGYVETTSPSTYSLTTTEGQNVKGVNFGDFQTVTLSGEVYNDLNGNGTLDNGEPGLSGWTLNLLNSSNQVIATTTSRLERRLQLQRCRAREHTRSRRSSRRAMSRPARRPITARRPRAARTSPA